MKIKNWYPSNTSRHQQNTTANINGKYQRQSAFFSANKLNKRFKLILGSYVLKDVSCQICHSDFQVPEEKKTDVNIATNMIGDCIYEKCDQSIIVSGDSDLTPPIEFIKNHSPDHQVYVYFPPRRAGLHLKSVCDNALYLEHWKKRFKTSLLPDSIKTKSGFELKRPTSWV
ncbi:NYN domain-containing protein [Roseivirga misakiensis]|uniref:NYN domain-containing protein n=1 Tax=Roseivirga misakiensis TaxID=1563681 RepID=UPI001C9E6F0B|nr:NYN domain-containing protein [Roseivirga misakiensis]